MKQLFIILLLPVFSFSQNTIGFPDVINYYRQNYQGGLQNWDIDQDPKSGLIYFANNEGLLSFDGKYWRLYPLPNKTIVRSVKIDPSGKIFVGGQDELGFFSPDRTGSLIYNSLLPQIPEKDRIFGDIWDIVQFNKEVFFRSSEKIIRFTGRTTISYPAPNEWAYLGESNNQLYAHDLKRGIFKYVNETWQPIEVLNHLPENDPVTGILTGSNGQLFITTLKKGIYIWNNQTITPHPSSNNRLFAEERIYGARKVDEQWIALATNNRGLYVIDQDANIIQHFSKKEQLQNENVLSLFVDNQKNLWLGLDNGIDLIAYNSAIKHIKPQMQDFSGYATLIHNGNLYAGTSNGLYMTALDNVPDLSFSKGIFQQVENTKGQTWSLSEINNRILLGHHEGAFVIEGNRAQSISSEPGFWNFTPTSSIFPTNELIGGHYKGIRFFNPSGKSFIPSQNISGFEESSRYLTIDQNGNFWVSHPYHGVFRINRQKENRFAVQTYTKDRGLPSTLNNHVFRIKNEIVVGATDGVYQYNASRDFFEPSEFYRNLLGNISIRYLKEDKEGNIWFIHEKKLGVIDMTEEKPQVIYLPELNHKMLSGFESFYSLNENNLFLGGEKGFYHINYAKYKKNIPSLSVQIRRVTISEKKDSLLYGGYVFIPENKERVKIEPEIHHQWKTIRFEFSTTLFGYQSNLEYSYRLKGFDKEWSEWSNRTDKEYTNLNPGTYVFEVKVRNNLGNESETSAYHFTILPPWYKSNWSKTIYFILIGTIFYYLYRWQTRRFNLQVQKLKKEQERQKYIHELEKNKTESELVALRNEKLEAEINFQHSEIASSAMHLVKKGELMSKLKSELMQLMKKLNNEEVNAELKKLIKSLSEDEQIDQEWENFTKHFDKVHSDFVTHLKKIHPQLTSNELKLCTYLRMNLSTKEIAQLTNISVRGVEISRYRLRKKMGIGSEISLFDYLMELQNNNSDHT
jgi:ligand-binding sensor domain-containing protein/DNA-binding NarL/FixJ family response regulator